MQRPHVGFGALKADLELTGGVLRLLSDDARFGDPFLGVATVVGDEGTATVKALMLQPGVVFSRAVDAAMRDALRRAGFERARFSRHRAGRVVWREVVL